MRKPPIFHLIAVVAAALCATACGNQVSFTPGATGEPDTHVDPGKPTLGPYVPLITADWSLSPGQEGYICATKTITETLYIGAIRPIASVGTHHIVVSNIFTMEPDDPGSPCGATFGDFYAAGLGTSELLLPPGVGLVAQAGQQLSLNLHLFNTSSDVMSATSGVEVRLLDASAVEHEASITFKGPLQFEIPAGAKHTATDETSFGADVTLVAIFPHMHKLGSHFTAEVVRSDGTIAIWDEQFQFESQEFSAIDPLTVKTNDILRTTCTWENTTTQTVFWGESSDAEMCFTILMKY
jgi:hypothetical protein